ncbi:MAG TPA: hypothetical protein VE032_03710 [Actinomycetota bacterium]|nr:hypothetical protein [Actinomycetota bacterium]
MRRLLLIVLLSFGLLPIATPARAVCAAPDPDTLTFEQMIDQGTTGDDDFDRMIIGRVVRVRDRGEVGGRATAVVHVAAHPTGYVPERIRVRFRAYPPGVWAEHSVEFAVGERWVIIAKRKDGGRYQHDGDCGQTQRVSRERYAELIASS